jgi:hypothetical protein
MLSMTPRRCSSAICWHYPKRDPTSQAVKMPQL